MSQINPTKTLDIVLKCFAEDENKTYSYHSLDKHFRTIGYPFSTAILTSILTVLQDDGYIQSILQGIKNKSTNEFVGGSKEYYRITFYGLIFYHNGGYEQEALNEQGNTTRVAKVEKQVRVLNWVVSIGAGGILLLEIIKLILQRLDMVWCNCK